MIDTWLKTIVDSLEETMEFCNSQDNLVGTDSYLRSRELEPIDFMRSIFYPECPAGKMPDDSYNSWIRRMASLRHKSVEELRKKRSHLLKKTTRSHDHKEGHILVCLGDTESVSDGASGYVSNGFFDDEDLPPWDTWIFYVPEDIRIDSGDSTCYLLSWVPEPLVEIVNKAIDANPVDCIYWLEYYPTQLTCRLQKVLS